jgi:hypothetical protein
MSRDSGIGSALQAEEMRGGRRVFVFLVEDEVSNRKRQRR